MAIRVPEQNDADFDQFGQTQFDAVQFFNDKLPTLNLASQMSMPKQTRAAELQSYSTDVQAFLTKLSAHSIKSSSELTSLTDEILRSGNRLAYEVEVLRGDVNSLYEVLTESLRGDISRFVFDEADQSHNLTETTATTNEINSKLDNEPMIHSNEPDFIRQLRVLGSVKSRLEAVIHVFGEALKWPIPPSEVSMTSNLISVSAPELGVVNSAEDDQAREYNKKLRNEFMEVLNSEGGGASGLSAATQKVNELRALSQVWRGTAEEKARARVVEQMARLVEDREKALDARATASRSSTGTSAPRSSSIPSRAGRIVEGSTNTAAGLFRNLQKLRDEIYQD